MICVGYMWLVYDLDICEVWLHSVICVAHVGPGHVGFESFDMNCVFGNEVQMTFSQMMNLKRLVEELPRPPIKEYVHCLMSTNVFPLEDMVSLGVLVFSHMQFTCN